ncbi:hypothetical protein BDV23DRAFT_177439 [Aspergillus alliaceus]|uniref:Uncharacterized protein n=1 Tax=Petromyces alliaceus TaxID=209559 RepID=A0A5N7BQK5_PETAA|nr:hypothetical protein BDV23DRAFT_177439 [Aspergillus alliaceus]
MVAIPLPDTDDPVEQGVQRMWAAIEDMVRKSQWTTLYRLLLAYMDADSVAKYQQLWQIATAHAPTERGEKKRDSGEGNPERKRWIISDMEQVYLEFYIKLINQIYYTQEYKSVLRDPESYPLILFRIIKITRFMIVQKTLHSTAAVDNIKADSMYSSGVENEHEPLLSLLTSPIQHGDPASRIQWSQNPSRKIFQEQVTWIVSQLMVRGTYTPIEILQDWQTYRLRIHYNIITPGHFTMGDFWGIELFAGLTYLMAGKGPIAHFIYHCQPTQFQLQLVIQYLQRVAQFREKLAVLVHVVGG